MNPPLEPVHQPADPPSGDRVRSSSCARARGTCAVVGCGTAGPAAAALLARAGWRVVLFERAPELAPVGAGLLLQPVGLRVLEEIGVLNETLALGSRVDRLRGRTISGRPVLDVSYGEIGEDIFGLGVQRSMLLRQLLTAAKREGVEVRLGVDVERIEESPRPRIMERASTDGRRSRSHGPFDLVILGSGARSQLRSHVSPLSLERLYPWGALWMTADLEPHELRKTRGRHDSSGPVTGCVLEQVYDSTTSMIGFLPSGRTQHGEPVRVSVFWSVRVSEIDRVRERSIEAWRHEASELCRAVLGTTIDVDRVVGQCATGADLIPATYMDVVCDRLVRGRVVLLGDAGHAMSPQLGLGANLALLDASILARILDQQRDIDRALVAFEHEVRGTHQYYGMVSRLLTPVFQSDEPVVGFIRDLAYHVFGRVPPIRREMLRALVGARRGWFRTEHTTSTRDQAYS
ncbi:MAG: FAD-dependent oxidoreductase [Phycisphaerales bacterium]|nr:MAG: FAD-dependent monooxygenase [Phycisphaerales bacterium]